MFNFRLFIQSPFKSEHLVHITNKFFRLTKNKTFEIEMYYYSGDLLEVYVDFSSKGHDHVGLTIAQTYFGLSLRMSILDNRHWDYETNDWEK